MNSVLLHIRLIRELGGKREGELRVPLKGLVLVIYCCKGLMGSPSLVKF